MLLLPAPHTRGLRSAALLATNTASGSTIGCPSGVLAGDLLVMHDVAINSTSAIPTTVLASGFTSINNVSAVFGGTQGYKGILSYKIATAADIGATFTGMNGTTVSHKIIHAYRANIPIRNVTVHSASGSTGDGALGPHTLTVPAAGVRPFVAIAAYRSSGNVTGFTAPYHLSATLNGINQNLSHGVRNFWDTVNVSDDISMTDAGSANIIQGCFISLRSGIA